MTESELTLFTLALALVLALVHLLAGKMRFLDVIPRSRWLSMAGGVSVAYVFVHMLPELSEGQTVLEEHGFEGVVAFLEHHVYLIALFGLVVFYGLERAAVESRQEQNDAAEPTSPNVFLLHLVSYSVYNVVIGYLLLHRGAQTAWALMTYFTAVALHFVVNDYGLRQHHKHRYHMPGRWVLAGAVVVGWAVGATVEVNAAALTVLFAFLAGGIVLNVLKEELPEERKSRFWAFALGCMAYVVLLLVGG